FSTWMVRPSRLDPFNRLIACSASSFVDISTNPKPRERPVSRSVTTVADSTAPAAAEASRGRALERGEERPPPDSLTAQWGAPDLGRKSRTRPDGARVHGEPTTARNLRSIH